MNIIEQIEREEIAKLTDGKDIPVFGPGDTVRVQVRLSMIRGEWVEVQKQWGWGL